MFDVRAAVETILDDGETDLDKMCQLLVDQIADAELREVLLVTVRPFVREAIGRRRMGNPILHPGKAVPTVPVIPAPRRPEQPSAKVAAIRNQWERALADLVYVGSNTYKALGDCGYLDLTFAANARQAMATATLAMAEQYRRLASALVSHGVHSVRELPEDIIGSIPVASELPEELRR